jgi:hypothetical protein
MIPEPNQTNEADALNVLRKRVLTIRGGTKTRDAIQIIITQETRAEGSEVLTPTIEFSGDFPTMIESGRYALDLGIAFIVASHYFDEWSKYVIGKR